LKKSAHIPPKFGQLRPIPLTFEKGVREIAIGALEAGLVLEKVLVYQNGREPLESYLGPPMSFCVN